MLPAGRLNSWSCPLCGQAECELFWQDRHRPYHRCRGCALVFVPAAWHLSPAAEQAHYDWHRNDPADPAYRRFLTPLFAALRDRLPAGAAGLDFGSGAGSALAAMLVEAGHPMALYDPYYHPAPEVLKGRYDFVTCTEVFEHFRRPGAEVGRLRNLLRPGGWLAVMTKQLVDVAAFPRWHYHLDPTHIAFYARETFAWLATAHGFTVEYPVDDVVLLHRPKEIDG